MGSHIALLVDDRDVVMIRCRVCAVECGIPPHLEARRLREFVEQHPPDTRGDSHPRMSPAGWLDVMLA
jgi:hypothetical protein